MIPIEECKNIRIDVPEPVALSPITVKDKKAFIDYGSTVNSKVGETIVIVQVVKVYKGNSFAVVRYDNDRHKNMFALDYEDLQRWINKENEHTKLFEIVSEFI